MYSDNRWLNATSLEPSHFDTFAKRPKALGNDSRKSGRLVAQPRTPPHAIISDPNGRIWDLFTNAFDVATRIVTRPLGPSSGYRAIGSAAFGNAS